MIRDFWISQFVSVLFELMEYTWVAVYSSVRFGSGSRGGRGYIILL